VMKPPDLGPVLHADHPPHLLARIQPGFESHHLQWWTRPAEGQLSNVDRGRFSAVADSPRRIRAGPLAGTKRPITARPGLNGAAVLRHSLWQDHHCPGGLWGTSALSGHSNRIDASDAAWFRAQNQVSWRAQCRSNRGYHR
jgi:hypothetical protein